MAAPRALLVPGSGIGHVNGFLLLARALSAAGFSVSFIYFSSEYSKLQKDERLPLQEPGITIHVVQDGIENMVREQYMVTEAMKEGLGELVQQLGREGKPVTCIVSDSFCYWTQDVADKLDLPRIDYWTSTAIGYIMLSNIDLLFEKGYLPEKGRSTLWRSVNPSFVDIIPGLPPMTVEHFPQEMRFAQPSHPWVRFLSEFGKQSKRAERILIHTLEELEPSAFNGFKEAHIQAYPTGPLLQYHSRNKLSDRQEPQEPCIAWLDTKAPLSVIYVAFGSAAGLSKEELIELAYGLESTNQPFLWAIRPDLYQGELSDVLPDGYLSRTQDRGLIIEWAPQLDVLAHPSVGGFFSHCGWNSVLESLWAGVPILACPRIADQKSNAHYITQVWKVGLEVERRDNGDLDRDHVESAINILMRHVEGEGARHKATEFMQIMRQAAEEGSTPHGSMQKFYEDLKARCVV